MTGPNRESVLIVGGGLSGFATVDELRRRGHEGHITIIDRDGVPYDRPPLSKSYLNPGSPPPSLELAADDWFVQQQVELVARDVVALDAEQRGITLDDGNHRTASAIVLATGGIPRRLNVPGGDHPAIHYLRTRSDADRLKEDLVESAELLVIGGGLIGAELASTAHDLGLHVTIVDPACPTLVAAVGSEVAETLHRMHAEAGVRYVQGTVSAVHRRDHGWRVEVLRSNGESTDLSAAVLVVAIGMVAATSICAGQPIAVEDGILVSADQRTSLPGWYAVGDCARPIDESGTAGVRHEHWQSALDSGRRAAASILGEPPAPPSAPWFWSDRYGHHVEAAGRMSDPGDTVQRDVLGGHAYFRILDGRLVGCVTIDAGALMRAARRIIDRGVPVTAEQLMNPATDLRKLAR